MNLREIKNTAWVLAEDTLQNEVGVYWPEMAEYINKAQQDWVLKVGKPEARVSVALDRNRLKYTMPTDLVKVYRAYFRGQRIQLTSEDELDSDLMNPCKSDAYQAFLRTPFGAIPVQLNQNMLRSTSLNTVQSWREERGALRSLVFSHSTARDFRLYPIPEIYQFHSDDNTEYGAIDSFCVAPQIANYVDANYLDDLLDDGSDGEIVGFSVSAESDFVYRIEEDSAFDGVQVSEDLLLVGLQRPPDLEADTDEPVIDAIYHRDLVNGALYYAYLKDGEMRNQQKAAAYLAKFEQAISTAKADTAVHSIESDSVAELGFA